MLLPLITAHENIAPQKDADLAQWINKENFRWSRFLPGPAEPLTASRQIS